MVRVFGGVKSAAAAAERAVAAITAIPGKAGSFNNGFNKRGPHPQPVNVAEA
jgi:hypothetical protein